MAERYSKVLAVAWCGIMVALAAPLASASELVVRLQRDWLCNPVEADDDCRPLLHLNAFVTNPSDHAVSEGSTIFGDSFSLEVFDSSGRLVAWWQPERYSIPPGRRVWEPGERHEIGIDWALTSGPQFELGRSEVQPRRRSLPPDGYQMVVVWRDLDGTELYRIQTWLEYLPGTSDDWPLNGRDVAYFESGLMGRRGTFAGVISTGHGPCWLEDRWTEIAEDGTVRVYVEADSGPFAQPDRCLFAVRAPRLTPGVHTVELYKVYHDEIRLTDVGTFEVEGDNITKPVSVALW